MSLAAPAILGMRVVLVAEAAAVAVEAAAATKGEENAPAARAVRERQGQFAI
jgi:hypothetical protein